jgi:hypothetical protein
MYQDIGYANAMPQVLPNGNLLVCGSRDSKGWLMELTSDLVPIKAFGYNGTQPFIGMVQYDASTMFVVDYSGDFYLISITDYSCILSLRPSAPPPNVGGGRAVRMAENGNVHVSYRGNLLYDVDVTARLANIRRQTYSGFGQPLESNATRGQRAAIDPDANMNVGWASRESTGGEEGDQDRFINFAIGLVVPAGAWSIETHPPYIGRAATVTVAEAPVALSAQPLPTSFPITIAPVQDLLPSLQPPPTTGVNAPNGIPAPLSVNTTITWDLQSAPICPPAFNAAIAGPTTAVQGTPQQYTAVITPDPALTQWPYT